MDNDECIRTEALIRELLDAARNQLAADTVEAVEHYLDHAEYEMALEGLTLDIMKSTKQVSVNWSTYKELAEKLGLDRETTFDADFWSSFRRYIDL